MSHQPGERIALIVNPTSNNGAGRVVGRQVDALLRAAGCQVTDASGDTMQEACTRAERAIADGVSTVCVVGGDGMAHLGTNLCAGRNVRLGVVPAGTGNDFARNLGIPMRDVIGAVRVVTCGGSRRIDAGLVRSGSERRWFSGVLGAGFDAVVNARASRMSWPRGRLRYVAAVLAELPRFHPIPYLIECDGVRLDTRAMLVAVANTTSFGGGMRVCPDAEPDDGLFDVLVVHEVSTRRFLRIFPLVYSGRHVGLPEVEIRRAARVRLEATGIPSQVDGEPFATLPLELEVARGVLTVAVPTGEPR